MRISDWETALLPSIRNPKSAFHNPDGCPAPAYTNTPVPGGSGSGGSGLAESAQGLKGASCGFENAASNTRSSITARREEDRCAPAGETRDNCFLLKREQPGSASHPQERSEARG
jgi:hypothetical protein